jgi:hypothetical protein
MEINKVEIQVTETKTAEEDRTNDTEKVWDRFIRNTAIFLSSAEA